MRTTLITAIELGIKQIARLHLTPKEYEEFRTNITRTKMLRVGPDHKTVYEVICDHATDIADYATNGKFSETSDEIEKKKSAAIHRIASALGWR